MLNSKGKHIEITDFPAIVYTPQDLSGQAPEAIWKVWIDFIIQVCKAIDPDFEADSSTVVWHYESTVVGYFDYYITSIEGFLPKHPSKNTINFRGECDLQYERENQDYLGFWVKFPEIPEGKLEGRIYYLETPHLTNLSVFAKTGFEAEINEKVERFLDKFAE
jgi:hypothetical protein